MAAASAPAGRSIRAGIQPRCPSSAAPAAMARCLPSCTSCGCWSRCWRTSWCPCAPSRSHRATKEAGAGAERAPCPCHRPQHSRTFLCSCRRQLAAFIGMAVKPGRPPNMHAGTAPVKGRLACRKAGWPPSTLAAPPISPSCASNRRRGAAATPAACRACSGRQRRQRRSSHAGQIAGPRFHGSQATSAMEHTCSSVAGVAWQAGQPICPTKCVLQRLDKAMAAQPRSAGELPLGCALQLNPQGYCLLWDDGGHANRGLVCSPNVRMLTSIWCRCSIWPPDLQVGTHAPSSSARPKCCYARSSACNCTEHLGKACTGATACRCADSHAGVAPAKCGGRQRAAARPLTPSHALPPLDWPMCSNLGAAGTAGPQHGTWELRGSGAPHTQDRMWATALNRCLPRDSPIE